VTPCPPIGGGPARNARAKSRTGMLGLPTYVPVGELATSGTSKMFSANPVLMCM